jgi:predicted site-specific integrase-resolvase
MPVKRASEKSKLRRISGHPKRPAKNAQRAGLYARVSSNDQQSLPMQLRALRDYAARRSCTIVHIKEVGSGASERQAQEKLIEATRRPEIDVVLVWTRLPTKTSLRHWP